VSRVPVILLSGFLGAGKTTLLNRILRQSAGLRVAVLENELGAAGIDTDLLASGAGHVVEVLDGCACCTLRGRLHDALTELAAVRSLDLVLVEASGIADPLPIVRAFQADGVRDALRIRELVTLVDARHADQSAAYPQWQRQIRFADRLILTKTDGLEGRELAAVSALVREHNHDAPIDTPSKGARAAVAEALASGAGRRPTSPPADDAPVDTHGMESVVLEVDGEIDRVRLERWLTALCAESDTRLLRAKGVLALRDEPRRYIIHGVHDLLDGRLDGPRSEPPRSRLVLIGHDLDRDELRRDFAACAAEPQGATRR
jgi:cobalamin biosynthesis protein CobW